MMNLEGAPQPLPPSADIDKLGLAERWILSRLRQRGRARSPRAIDAYEFNAAALRLYQFIWHEFCDWYIELAKDPLKARRRGAGGGALGAGAMLRSAAAAAASVHAVHLGRDLAGASPVSRRRRPGAASGDRALPRSPATSRCFRDDEQTAMARCIEVTEAINSYALAAGFHPGQRVNAR